MNTLSVKNLSIRKARTPQQADERATMILNDINFKISEGEILGIIGPNGAGKSTLLKALCDDISFHGEISLSNFSNEPKHRAKQLSVLPQLSLLNFSYRVSEVVMLGRTPHQTGHQVDEQIVAEALALMDISYLSDRPYTQLSGGEKQRVQLARVLAQIWRKQDADGPRLLLLDEPTTALDLGHQQSLMQAVKHFASQGVSVIMVLHDINLAARYSDKLLALLCSEQIAFGDVDDVVNTETINRLFSISSKIMTHPTTGGPFIVSE